MELKIRDGAYVPDGRGGLVHVDGKDALMQRVMLRLTARRGTFPFLTDFGSRLYALGRTAPQQRQSAAEQAVAEALSDEDLMVKTVTLTAEENGAITVGVELADGGETLSAEVEV